MADGRPSPTRRERVHSGLSVPIARVAGIQIRMHLTFLLLVVLFAAAFSGPGRPGPLAGVAWLVAIFMCVLAHEMAHCLVARRRGGVVHEIVLLPIGGVSKMERLPESPADEFAIAIAGPATSVGIGVGAALVSIAVGQPLIPVDLVDGAIVHRLAWLNLALGAFNLLPAFPLDGGRVLRSLLERRFDLETATRRAASIGRVFAVFLGAIGVLYDIWLVIIAVFVYFGASAEEVATIVHVRLQGRTVGDLMLLDPVVLPAASSVRDAHEVLRHTAQRTFPVVESGHYLGVVGARALLGAVPDRAIGELADRSVPAVAASDPAEGDALELLRSYEAVAVLQSGHVVGLLQRDDVRHLIEEVREHT